MGKHPTVKLTAPWGEEIDIDKGLAKLIRLVWDHGIKTHQSCQEWEPGWACIEFRTVHDTEAFLNLAQEGKVEGLVSPNGPESQCVHVIVLRVWFLVENIPHLERRLLRLKYGRPAENEEADEPFPI